MTQDLPATISNLELREPYAGFAVCWVWGPGVALNVWGAQGAQLADRIKIERRPRAREGNASRGHGRDEAVKVGRSTLEILESSMPLTNLSRVGPFSKVQLNRSTKHPRRAVGRQAWQMTAVTCSESASSGQRMRLGVPVCRRTSDICAQSSGVEVLPPCHLDTGEQETENGPWKRGSIRGEAARTYLDGAYMGGIWLSDICPIAVLSENSEPSLQRSSRWAPLACRWSTTSAVEYPAKAKLAGVGTALDLGPNGNANGFGIWNFRQRSRLMVTTPPPPAKIQSHSQCPYFGGEEASCWWWTYY
ncbi:hypothetical protein FA13DRAFT_1709404 [Coprinellus micaceus]|uniref:Uncharacterized protein n=1 Tax=Coprinellus micaceus TaxID=71717 RepID=A0A4Y7TEI3_COPMI|nr:hypothetical protein FA13DRAFT_1709404 [Coprinellus micaceus]